MTRNEVIRAMRSVCDKDKVDAWHNDFWTITQEELERFAALVAAAEREACAKVCDEIAQQDETGYGIAEDCASTIRARSKE